MNIRDCLLLINMVTADNGSVCVFDVCSDFVHFVSNKTDEITNLHYFDVAYFHY